MIHGLSPQELRQPRVVQHSMNLLSQDPIQLLSNSILLQRVVHSKYTFCSLGL